MTENVKYAMLVILQYSGWATAAILFVNNRKQRREAGRLREVVAQLKAHDAKRQAKDKIRDKILLKLAGILSDEVMHLDNKKKLDKLFSELNEVDQAEATEEKKDQ